MNAVVEHGTPLVDDPDRIGAVEQLGIDETSFPAANRSHATVYATGLVDLEAKVVIDMVEGNAAADPRRWTAKADPGWLGGIEVVATDLAESFRAGLSGHERLDDVGHQRMLLGLRVGDPSDEVLGAWLAKESVRDVQVGRAATAGSRWGRTEGGSPRPSNKSPDSRRCNA